MKYFKIWNSAEKEIGSEYPQCQDMIKSYDWDAENSIDNLNKLRGKALPFVPNLDGVVMRSKAKKTDMLSVAMLGHGLFINDRFLDILRNYELCPHQVFKATVLHKANTYNYNWVHFTADYSKNIDFPKSIFTIRMMQYSGEHYVFKDYEDYKHFDSTHTTFGLYKVEKMVLRNIKSDVIYVSDLDHRTYFSEQLVNAIRENKITGIDIEEAEYLSVE